MASHETNSSSSADTPAPSLVESRGSVDAAASPASQMDDLFDYPISIKQESTDATFPVDLETMDAKPAALSHLDQTQHSAAMLCDLQCRSRLRSSSSRRLLSITPTSSTSNSSTSYWATLFLYLMTLQLQTSYKAILMALWTISPSRMTARLMQAASTQQHRRSTSRSTTSSMTPPRPLSRSTRALAQQCNAATARVARQGALEALQSRRSALLGIAGVRGRAAVAAGRQQHQQTVTDTMVFEEHDQDGSDLGNGEGRSGVGRL